jgi:hypothetical protein
MCPSPFEIRRRRGAVPSLASPSPGYEPELVRDKFERDPVRGDERGDVVEDDGELGTLHVGQPLDAAAVCGNRLAEVGGDCGEDVLEDAVEVGTEARGDERSAVERVLKLGDVVRPPRGAAEEVEQRQPPLLDDRGPALWAVEAERDGGDGVDDGRKRDAASVGPSALARQSSAEKQTVTSGGRGIRRASQCRVVNRR